MEVLPNQVRGLRSWNTLKWLPKDFQMLLIFLEFRLISIVVRSVGVLHASLIPFLAFKCDKGHDRSPILIIFLCDQIGNLLLMLAHGCKIPLNDRLSSFFESIDQITVVIGKTYHLNLRPASFIFEDFWHFSYLLLDRLEEEILERILHVGFEITFSLPEFPNFERDSHLNCVI
jgi:hypothetical protein